MDADVFKSVLGQWPSGVTVVTTKDGETPYGLTASSFSSVSLDPPLISVCVLRGSRTHDAIVRAERFAVNILGVDQVAVGTRFAGSAGDPAERFAGLAVSSAVTGAPVLPEAMGWLDCRLYRAYEGGDHTIFVGEVLEAGTSTERGPLLYHARSWGRFHGAFPVDVELTECGAAGLTDLPLAERAAALSRVAAAGASRLHLGEGPDAVALLPALAAATTIVRVGSGDELTRAARAGASLVEVAAATGDVPSALLQAAREADVAVRVLLDGSLADGAEIDPGVPETARALADAGAGEIALNDTHGTATPQRVRDVLAAVRPAVGRIPITLSCKDTRGLALTNALAGANSGVRLVDCALGGVGRGGLPATEDVAHLFEAMGMSTGLDRHAVSAVAAAMAAALGRELPGHLYRVDAEQSAEVASRV